MLDIIIPQYMEDEHKIKDLLDSIENQKNIDFHDIHVTIINDASNVLLSNEFLMKYEKLNILYLRNDKNLGPGLTRQRGIDMTDEPFIMFFDADDRLIDLNVLSKILDYLKKYNPDYLVTNIMVEVYFDNQKSLRLRKREETFPWMHGKAYKRFYLKDHNLRFHPHVRHLEDSYFTSCLLGTLSPKEIHYLDIVSYLWKMNEQSLTRKKSKYNYMVDIFDDFMSCARYVYDYLTSIKSKMRFPYFIQSTLGIYTVLNSNLFDFDDLKDKREAYLKDLHDYVIKKKNIYKLVTEDILLKLYEKEIRELKERNNLRKIYKGLNEFFNEFLI